MKTSVVFTMGTRIDPTLDLFFFVPTFCHIVRLYFFHLVTDGVLRQYELYDYELY